MEELLSLIQETRSFFLSQQENNHYFEEEDSSLNKPLAPFLEKSYSATQAEKKTSSSSVLPLSLPPSDLGQERKKEIFSEKIPLLTENSLGKMKQLIKKHSPKNYREDLPIFIKLLTTRASSLPFLQRLEQAITDSILPAKTFLIDNSSSLDMHLCSPSLKMFMIPLTEVEEHIKNMPIQIHEVAKFNDALYWFPLYSSDLYLKDPELKRSLWNKLKSLPFDNMLA